MNDTAATDVSEGVLRLVRVSLLRTLAARFPGTPRTTDIGAAIQAQTDLPTLLRWYERVAVAGSLDEVRAFILPVQDKDGQPVPQQSDAAWLGKEFFENRRKFPPEKLLDYLGRHVAWSWDGTHIVDSDPDEAELRRKLEVAGVDAQRVVFSYVPEDPDASWL